MIEIENPGKRFLSEIFCRVFPSTEIRAPFCWSC